MGAPTGCLSSLSFHFLTWEAFWVCLTGINYSPEFIKCLLGVRSRVMEDTAVSSWDTRHPGGKMGQNQPADKYAKTTTVTCCGGFLGQNQKIRN